MSVYLVADVKILDDSWIPDYAARMHEIVEKHRGKYLSRSANITPIEGDPPDTTVVVIVEFPTTEAVKAFVSDPEYAPFQQSRIKGTVSRLFVIDATDVAGTIPYLEKAE